MENKETDGFEKLDKLNQTPNSEGPPELDEPETHTAILETKNKVTNIVEKQSYEDLLSQLQPGENYNPEHVASMIHSIKNPEYTAILQWHLALQTGDKQQKVETLFDFDFLSAHPDAFSSEGFKDAWKRTEGVSKPPASMEDMKNLTILRLNNLGLTKLPENIKELTHLEKFYAEGNTLKEIPEWMTSMTNLDTIDFDRNRITSIPEQLSTLTKLRHIELNANEISSLPEFLGSLKNLQILEVNNNKLTKIPESLEVSESLQILDVSKNPGNMEYLKEQVSYIVYV